MKRDPRQDADGAALRHAALEAGGAEMARARRYGRSLAIVTLSLRGDHERAPGPALTIVESVLRHGADKAIGPAGGRMVVLLPETNLSGGIHMASRLQERLLAAGVKNRVGFAALQDEDSRFPDMLARADAMARER